MERFNRTLKDKWMNGIDWNEIKSIQDLNGQLEAFIQTYNNTIHQSLKRTPNQAYFEDVDKIKFLDADELNKNFYHTVIRKVNKIGNVKIDNRTYEVDYSLSNQKLEFTYDPENTSVIYHEGKAYSILDSVSNSKKRRKKNVDYSKIINKENEDILEYEGE